MELTLKDSEIRKTIGEYLDSQLFNYYDAAVIKAAGIPNRKALIEQTMSDAQFQKTFTKFLMQYIDGDLMMDAVAEACPNHDAFQRVEAAFDQKNTVDREKTLEAEDQMAIKRLTARGYKVTK